MIGVSSIKQPPVTALCRTSAKLHELQWARSGPRVEENRVCQIQGGSLRRAGRLWALLTARWLTVLNRVDPVTYAVDPIRGIVFARLTLPPAVRSRLDPGVTWNGWHVPTALEIGLVAAMGLTMLAIAVTQIQPHRITCIPTDGPFPGPHRPPGRTL